MDKEILYPILEGKIAEKGLSRARIAEALNIKPNTLWRKINGKTEFTWNEVVCLQTNFFPEITKDHLMQRKTEPRPA